MKSALAFFLSLISFSAFSQTKLPVIRANSAKAKIYEQFGAVSNWNINPKLKPDVHSTGKLSRPIIVRFSTDIDSISFRLAPGKYKDFIVLLNGKDSCLTRIECTVTKDFSKLATEIHDTIPFVINKFNTNYVPGQTPYYSILTAAQPKSVLLPMR